MRRVDGFEHRTGHHCGSTSLRNLADYYGWGYDEATAFGLASGLGFTYFELPESPHRAFFGRPLWLELAFFAHLGIGYEHRGNSPWAETWDAITTAVDADDPVLVFTDIYHLDYYETDTHFTPHSLLVVGCEGTAEAGRVLLADSEFEELQELPAGRLREAMGSEYSIPLPNRHLVLTDTTPDRGTSAAAGPAIHETAEYLLDPSTARFELGPGEHGLPGIRALADDLPGWVDLPEPQWTVRFAYQNIEKRGTGGGCFRRLYADFLETAAAAVPEVPADASERMREIATDWTAAGETLQTASECETVGAMEPHLEAASEELHAIADREERLFADLLAAVTR